MSGRDQSKENTALMGDVVTVATAVVGLGILGALVGHMPASSVELLARALMPAHVHDWEPGVLPGDRVVQFFKYVRICRGCRVMEEITREAWGVIAKEPARAMSGYYDHAPAPVPVSAAEIAKRQARAKRESIFYPTPAGRANSSERLTRAPWRSTGRYLGPRHDISIKEAVMEYWGFYD